MKNLHKGIIVLFIILCNFSFAQTKNHFKVKGSCEMCKERIEETAREAGAKTAVYSLENQILQLETDESKVSFDAILKKIAEVGHDNEKYRATDEVYEKLAGCCHYERDENHPSSEKIKHDTPKETHDPEHNAKEIKSVNINVEKQATALNKKEAGLTFNIHSKELLKAACCNLSESFETNATVDVSFSNAVTGTKQLKMLGLDQKYTSLTKELLPEIRGLASAYGLSFIPGRWIGGIQLTKGGSSVTNGYESITGQINTELVKLHEKPETSLNLFSDFNDRVEANIVHTNALNGHWNQSILLHGNATIAKVDHNNDGFLDRPKGHQLNATYLLNYNDLDHTGWATHIGMNFLLDKRIAGQINFDERKDLHTQNAYGVGIDISRFQLWNKTGYVFKGKPYQSIGWMNQFTHHEQDSYFGQRTYYGTQRTYYSNLIFESIFGNTNHKYKTGASWLYDDYSEEYLLTDYKRTESVPGLFFEYTLTGAQYVLVAGVRTDFHNLAGTQFTPRVNFKYDITPKTILRLSAGKGFRTANIFAENQQYFASNRQIEILKNDGKIYGLKPEIAWNYGASLHQEFRIFNKKSSLLIDFFRTDFTHQVVVDLDASTQKLLFYNLNGASFANSFQTQWDIQPAKNLELRLAYKFYDVKANYQSGKREVPFMAKHRGFFNLAYSTPKTLKDQNWTFDTTLHWIGKQRLPQTSANPIAFQLPEYSKSYATLNAQIARNFNKNIRGYFGGENLTGFTQKNPIIDAKNPFGNYFDGGMIYAPIMPINLYLGLDVIF
ncbi:MAG: TonB-dependent receptor [Cloacibacterium sp.]|nr:TonB-dependent receptor [Cloacibacterium sp.]